MLPTLFSIKYIGEQTQLYMNELSTSNALKTFLRSTPIIITEFGADNDISGGWVSKKDLPDGLHTVGVILDFLTSNESLSLVDFSASIEDGIELSTHDDGEALFTFLNRPRAIEVLSRFIKDKESPELFHIVVKNAEKYILLENGQAEIFNSFQEYIKYNPLPTPTHKEQ